MVHFQECAVMKREALCLDEEDKYPETCSAHHLLSCTCHGLHVDEKWRKKKQSLFREQCMEWRTYNLVICSFSKKRVSSIHIEIFIPYLYINKSFLKPTDGNCLFNKWPSWLFFYLFYFCIIFHTAVRNSLHNCMNVIHFFTDKLNLCKCKSKAHDLHV